MKHSIIIVLIILFHSFQSNAKGNNLRNIEITETPKDTIIEISVNKTDLKIKYNSSTEFNVQKITKDTIYVFSPSISEIKSINLSDNQQEWKIYQRYKSQLLISYDGKAFLIDNWKSNYSPWIEIWEDYEQNNIKSYSYFDEAYFPNFTEKELINGIKINSENFSKYWNDFFIQSFENNLKPEDNEPFYSPIITESHFKLTNKNGENLIIIVKHQIGC